jgi:hypothetical protein
VGDLDVGLTSQKFRSFKRRIIYVVGRKRLKMRLVENSGL